VSTQRLTSLDAFRGVTIAAMILVNNPGSWSHVYGPLLHAKWHGWTPTDLIFPFFLFIMGVAMSFSLVARQEAGTQRTVLLRKALKRSVVIIALGLLMSGFPRYHVATMRFPGVLQRIGLVYALASAIVLYTRPSGIALACGALLLVYWALMSVVPVPGFGPGVLTPEGNLGAYIDRAVFGSHLYRTTWDPEGLLSSLPAVATTLTGVLTGGLLRSGRQRVDITGSLFVWGWVAIVLGLAWTPWFPINKNLWTSSYVLFTTGAALHTFGVCYWLIEVKERRAWAHPAVVFGVNAIAVFVLSGLVARLLLLTRMTQGDTGSISLYGWIYQRLCVPLAGPLNGSLLFALATVAFWFGAMLVLYRKGIVIKV
jgi:predicted acyltransferase